MRLGDDSEAIDSFNRALEINPDYADADYNTAACYALQGEVELALDNLQQAIEVNSKYKDYAETDLDVEEISADEGFQELIESYCSRKTLPRLRG